VVSNKFGAKKITAPDGTVFDSKAEYRRWCELRLLEEAGKISDLQRQVKYELIPAQYETYERYSEKTGKRLTDGKRCVEQGVSYIADFVYWEGDQMIVEDVKGHKKGAAYELYRLKAKLMMHFYGIRVQEVSHGR
jgi:hypothetical protein